MPRWLGRAAVLICLLLPRGASAGPIVWQLNGQIEDSPSGNPLEGYLPVGTDVNFLLTLDSASPDLCDAAGAGFYHLPGGAVDVNGSAYQAANLYLEANNPDGSCVPGYPSGMTMRMFFDTAPFSAAVITWSGDGESVPHVPPSSAEFSMSYVYPDAVVSGDVTSGAVVPEPSTLLLMLPALSAIIVRHRRRQR